MEIELLDLSNLYSVAGAVITAMYIPQTLAVMKAKTTLQGISLLTWTVWGVCLFISFLYAYQIAHDLRIAMVNFFGCLFCFMISGTTLYKRQKYKDPSKGNSIGTGTKNTYKTPNQI